MSKGLDPGQEVSITIYGNQFTLRTYDDPALLETLAKEVDREMYRVAEDSGVMQALRVAILTALHIADELHRLRTERKEIDERLNALLARLEPMLDEAVGADA